MKWYNYFLFRLFKQLESKNTEEKTVVLLTITTSTFLLLFLLMVILLFCSLFIFPIPLQGLSRLSVLIIFISIGCLNYFFFIRNRKFLDCNFKQDKYGVYYIFLAIIILFTSFIVLANINRSRMINKESLKPGTSVPKLINT
ncbi:MAG: hypothetical protein DI539_02180 [Flavobacterium psychrophilum]|nr:MAG: hypothetical protein DI539_02180 [Flavobacterium psychrophilum]